MVSLQYSASSKKDLKDIYAFISYDSSYYAKQFVRDLKEKIKSLKKYPEQGRLLQTDKFSDLRQILYGSYRIIYVYDSDTVSVISIHRQSRELNNIDALKPFEI